ncbi:uncharacterized protein [Equus caballus]|uniref:uncharacterized protein isoform X1 n=1 Tax=Equus caballus TaxID=9796 RepID=UPI0038B2ECC0
MPSSLLCRAARSIGSKRHGDAFPATELSIQLKPRLFKTHLLRSYRNGGPGRALKNFTKLCTKDQRVSRKLLMEEARPLLLLLSLLHVQGQGTLPAPEEATSLWETLDMDPWIAQERQQWQVRVPVVGRRGPCVRGEGAPPSQLEASTKRGVPPPPAQLLATQILHWLH